MALSYEDEVLLDVPVLYWRLDMVGPATNGDEVPDISGNDLHGDISYSAGSTQPYGYDSPIETDVLSKEIRIYNAGDFTHFAGLTRSSDTLIEIAGDQTIEFWTRPFNVQETLIQKVIFAGTAWKFGLDSQGRFYFEILDTVGNSFRATAPGFGSQGERLDGESYHVVGVRSGNAMGISIDGYLQATTIITSGLPSLTTSGQLVLGAAVSGPSGARFDEFAIYDHALGPDRILAHYEAAKLRLPMRATISVLVSVTLLTDQVVPVDFPFVHNFAAATTGEERALIERWRYSTDMLESFVDYEQRVNDCSYGPQRSVIYDLTSTSANERSRILNRLWLPGQTYRIPIRSDWTPLTAQADAGDDEIECDTLGKDFAVGSKAIVMAAADPISITNYEVVRIEAINADSIEISGLLANTWPAETTLIAPYRLALVNQSSLPLKSHARSKQTLQIEFDIVRSEVMTNRVTEFVPALSYRDLEVFQLTKAQVAWLEEVDSDITRRAQMHTPRFGPIYSRNQDTGSPQTHPVRLQFNNRAAQAEYFGWLESRQGKARPLWLPSYEDDFELVSWINPGNIKVVDTDYKTYINLHEARRDVAFILNDGSILCRRITGATDNGDGTESLSISPNLDGGDYNDVLHASLLHQVRLNADDVEFAWHRDLSGNEGDMILESTVTFRELLTSPV